MLRTERIFVVAILGAALSPAEIGTTPKPKPEDYPAEVKSAGLTIAAEYLLHTAANARQSFVVPDYLVVEVAVYPAKGQRVVVSNGLFTLRINGKKQELSAQAPGMVAAALKYADWESRHALEVQAGPIVLGRQRTGPRFPGDNRPDTGRPAGTSQTTENSQYGDRNLTGPDAVTEWAFPDGEHGAPASGFVYFAFKGKPKSIRSLELIFHRGEQPVVLKLF